MKFKIIWNKINPLDYKENPIGSLKLEIYFWVALISLISYISGSVETFNMIFNLGLVYIPFWLVIIFGIITWMRISILITRYLKIKDDFGHEM
jgi:hypothetical protein